ncbi:MAG: hypothetical protein D6786_01820 [Gammaproteobacteria bacterium]|nr:MAG: hypothetical protein D6786_01820 [Gammaproteobacteria bacterium]
MPLGLILGQRDRVVPMEVAGALAAIRPGLWLEVMEGCGHAPFLSSPGGFAEGCRRFVGHALPEVRG